MGHAGMVHFQIYQCLTLTWNTQAKLPKGASLLGTILSSDKTNITTMTGGRVAHPLLISSANISMDFRSKASNHAFLLLALLPIPHYIQQKPQISSLLENRLFHECLDIVLEPLKCAAKLGIMLSDPAGYQRWCFSPLAAYIVDTPESALIAGVGGKTSSVTTATYLNFGDNFQHPPRLASHTLQHLQDIENIVHPWDLKNYQKEASKVRLNGVHRPFWMNWPLSEPSTFLTPEPLHHWHKQFWDHDVQWCLNVVGRPEIDFRFSILPPHTGYQHFNEGISRLKQVSGRDHRDIQRFLVPVIAGAVDPEFLIAIRALLDFRYWAQSSVLDNATLDHILECLETFHSHKQAVTNSGGRRGKHGPLEHWQIPKLEWFQNVVPNIKANGVASQWSADMTEHEHIEVVKKPARASNNQDYEKQICRYLDRLDKIANFDLATAIQAAHITLSSSSSSHSHAQFTNTSPSSSSNELSLDTSAELLSLINPVTSLPGSITPLNPGLTDYFYSASLLSQGNISNAPIPHRTVRVSPNVVYHLSRDPAIRKAPPLIFATQFGIPDLVPALGDFITRLASNPPYMQISGRRIASANCFLPFSSIEVWTSLRLQTRSYLPPHMILPSIALNASPPSNNWPHGRYDSALFNITASHNWPQSGLQGMNIPQLFHDSL